MTVDVLILICSFRACLRPASAMNVVYMKSRASAPSTGQGLSFAVLLHPAMIKYHQVLQQGRPFVKYVNSMRAHSLRSILLPLRHHHLLHPGCCPVKNLCVALMHPRILHYVSSTPAWEPCTCHCSLLSYYVSSSPACREALTASGRCNCCTHAAAARRATEWLLTFQSGKY